MAEENRTSMKSSQNNRTVSVTFKNMKRFTRVRMILLVMSCVIGSIGVLLLGLSFAISSWWFTNTPPSIFSSWNHYWLGVPYQFWIYFLGYSVLSVGGIINFVKKNVFWARALIVAVSICGFFHLVGIGTLILHWMLWIASLPPPTPSDSPAPISGYHGDPLSGDGTSGFGLDLFGFCFSFVVVVGGFLALSILNLKDTKAYLEHATLRFEETKGLKLEIYGVTSGYKLIILANRDEFLDRATEPAHFWKEHPNILAGRDLVQGGTWFGITKTGKIGMITNYREAESKVQGNPISRGLIVSHFLQDEKINAKDYIDSLHEQRHRYEGFHCILGNVNELWYYSNRENEPKPIQLQSGKIVQWMADTKAEAVSALGRRPDSEGRRRRRRRREAAAKEDPMASWVPVTKLGRLVKEGKIAKLEEIYLHSLPIKEHQIIDYFFDGGKKLKDEVMKIMPVQKQTAAGQRTRFKAYVVIGDMNGHVGLGVKCSREVATAIRAAIVLAKLALVPVRRGYWGNKIGKPHTVPMKVTGKCGSVTVRLVPAPRGTGIVSARVPKKVLQLAGVDDCFTRSRGNTKTLGNFVRATYDALAATYGYLTPDLWQEYELTKSPIQEFSDLLSQPKIYEKKTQPQEEERRAVEREAIRGRGRGQRRGAFRGGRGGPPSTGPDEQGFTTV